MAGCILRPAGKCPVRYLTRLSNSSEKRFKMDDRQTTAYFERSTQLSAVVSDFLSRTALVYVVPKTWHNII